MTSWAASAGGRSGGSSGVCGGRDRIFDASFAFSIFSCCSDFSVLFDANDGSVGEPAVERMAKLSKTAASTQEERIPWSL